MSRTETVEPVAPAVSVGAASWVRPWSVELDVTPIPHRIAAVADGEWQVFAPAGHPFAPGLGAALARAGVGAGVLVCLPPACAEGDLELALRGAKAVPADLSSRRFVLVQHDRSAAGAGQDAASGVAADPGHRGPSGHR
ncbi:hypothetical protein ACLQ22_30305 [Micromonospora sp. DT178]|uniref:hypothetical protein n=1 Tax=Micromonospora sp. DT178 TaxID=3393436 RepID=UPI003CF4D3D7